MNILLGAFLSFIGISFTVSSSVPRGEYGEIKLFQSPATYSVESMVLLNDAGRKDKEVGYKVAASLDVQAMWGNDTEFLLKFGLHSTKLLAKGKLVKADYLPIKSFWDSYHKTEFYAHWKNGLIAEAYLNPEEISDVLNYKKSLISLFQLQIIDGEHNETDISGTCDVVYDSISMQVIRKTKRRCQAAGVEKENSDEEVVTSRRLTRYTLNEKLDMLEEVHAEEVHTVGVQEMDAALKARAWMRLKRVGPLGPAASTLPDLASALAELPAYLMPLPLPMPITDEPLEDEESLDESLEESLEAALDGGEGEEAGGGGTGAEAASALNALRALRRAQPARLAAALSAQTDSRRLAVLCRLLGAAGAAGAQAAAARGLPLSARDAPPLAARYLQALALAHAPDESVVRDVLKLGEESREGAVQESALLAAAACAARLPAARLAAAVRDALVRPLARCKDESCRGVYLRALGNLRRGDTAELLLEHTERGGAAALHALPALAALPAAALGPARLRRLAALAAAARRPLELRAAALELLLLRAAPLPPPLALARLARELHAHGPPELRRLLWQRARQLAALHRPLADVLAMLEPDLRGWDALAQSGTSSVLVRELGRMGPGSARLESLQLTRAGLLRRGSVRLLLDTAPEPLLAIELWTKGLESVMGGAGEEEAAGEGGEEGEAEEMSAGLAFTVAGARLPGVTLFTGQAELLGHVWAGTGSAPTPALRALLPLGERGARLALLGAAPLRLRAGAALALALDAQAQVSLWARSARGELRLRLGAAGEARAELGGGGGGGGGAAAGAGRLRARAAWAAEPRLRVSADLDFYDGVALCVRVATDDHVHRSNVTLSSELGAQRRSVRRSRSVRRALAGRTLALGARNDAACRALPAPAD